MALKGRAAFNERMKTARGAGIKAALRTLYVGADMIRAEAHRLISEGSISGKGHVPSRPGEPPNRDTGVLQAGLEVGEVQVEGGHIVMNEVKAMTPYSAPLEFGTSKMAARPFMAPARDNKAAEINRMFAQEFNKARRKGI